MMAMDKTLRLRLAARTLIEWKTPVSSPEYHRVLRDLIKAYQKTIGGQINPNSDIIGLDKEGIFLWYLSGQLNRKSTVLNMNKEKSPKEIEDDELLIKERIEDLIKGGITTSEKRKLSQLESINREKLRVTIKEGLLSNDDGVQELALIALTANILPYNEKVVKSTADRLEEEIKVVKNVPGVRLDWWTDIIELAIGLIIPVLLIVISGYVYVYRDEVWNELKKLAEEDYEYRRPFNPISGGDLKGLISRWVFQIIIRLLAGVIGNNVWKFMAILGLSIFIIAPIIFSYNQIKKIRGLLAERKAIENKKNREIHQRLFSNDESISTIWSIIGKICENNAELFAAAMYDEAWRNIVLRSTIKGNSEVIIKALEMIRDPRIEDEGRDEMFRWLWSVRLSG